MLKIDPHKKRFKCVTASHEVKELGYVLSIKKLPSSCCAACCCSNRLTVLFDIRLFALSDVKQHMRVYVVTAFQLTYDEHCLLFCVNSIDAWI